MVEGRGLDERTRALYERIRTAPNNRPLIRAVEAPTSEVALAPQVASRVCFVLVPGIFYRDYPHTGADGAALREIAASLSIPLITIPLDGTEGRDAAARTICNFLESSVPKFKTAILVSLSKGSTEVMHTLADTGNHAAFKRVTAWVSVSGLPLGTPSLELVLRNPVRRLMLNVFCLFKGWKLSVLRDLLLHRPPPETALPAHMKFFQVAAFPLHDHLSDRRSRHFQRALARLGPNDGYALLEELSRLPGHMYPMWGVDHYLKGEVDLSARMRNLLTFVLQNSGMSQNDGGARVEGK